MKPDNRRHSLLFSEQLAYAVQNGKCIATGFLTLDSRFWTQARAKGDGTFALDMQGLSEGDVRAVVEFLRSRCRLGSQR